MVYNIFPFVNDYPLILMKFSLLSKKATVYLCFSGKFGTPVCQNPPAFLDRFSHRRYNKSKAAASADTM